MITLPCTIIVMGKVFTFIGKDVIISPGPLDHIPPTSKLLLGFYACLVPPYRDLD